MAQGSPRQSSQDVMRAHHTRSYGPNVKTHDHTINSGPATSYEHDGHPEHDKVIAERLHSGSIMVAVNGGTSGWTALDWAAAEASAHHSALRILHAIAWPRWGLDQFGELALDWCDTKAPDRGTLILEEAARRAHVAAPFATITTHLEAGDPALTIVRASRSDALIVVGRGPEKGHRRRSVAGTVCRLARCPIAVIQMPVANRSNGGRR